MYQCAALNIQNSIIRFSTSELRVIDCAPTFIKRPMQGTVRGAIGSNVTIVCNPEGAPKPIIQWYQNGYPISSDFRRRVLLNGNLVITGILASDEGNYTCDASNRNGRELGFTYLYIVYGTQIQMPTNPQVYANVNETFIIPCVAYKPVDIDLSYTWKFNNETVHIDGKRYARNVYNRPGDLRIIRIQFTQQGRYTCVAKTTVDEVSITFMVFVRGPPGQSAGVKCSNMGKTTAVVSFVGGTDNNDPIVNYTIEAITDRNPVFMPVLANFTLQYNAKGEYSVLLDG